MLIFFFFSLNNWLLSHPMTARGGWSKGPRGGREAASGERTHYATEPTGAHGEKEGGRSHDTDIYTVCVSGSSCRLKTYISCLNILSSSAENWRNYEENQKNRPNWFQGECNKFNWIAHGSMLYSVEACYASFPFQKMEISYVVSVCVLSE